MVWRGYYCLIRASWYIRHCFGRTFPIAERTTDKVKLIEMKEIKALHQKLADVAQTQAKTKKRSFLSLCLAAGLSPVRAHRSVFVA